MLLQGCFVSTINPNAVQRMNASLDKLDENHGRWAPSRYEEEERRLWADKPQFAALVDFVPVKRMRVISAVAPSYPTLLRMAHINASVIVSFVVGVNGHVEDARIIESSDSRFNGSVLVAIQKFTFSPALGPNGPVREIAMLPLNFNGSPNVHY